MKSSFCLLAMTMSLPLIACTGAIAGGDPISGAAGVGVINNSGTAGTNLVGSGAGGTNVLASGAGGSSDPTGAAGAGVVSTGAGGAAAPACGPGAIPADVAAVISAKCIACHGSPPVAGVPSSLATYAALTASATTDKTKTVAQVALARITPGAAMPMPPAPFSPATASDVAAFQAWVSAGTPPATCAGGGTGGGTGGAGGAVGGIADPYSTPVVCTSNTMWTLGNRGDGIMDPGQACIACHSKGEGPNPPFVLGGTVYPSAHEPDNCNGGPLTQMARVVITGADGMSVTLKPNSAGNFSYSGVIATPYTAMVTYMGRERGMIAKQMSGDCNSCHTETGAMMAPGRIMLP
jgi:hypothetical protein